MRIPLNTTTDKVIAATKIVNSTNPLDRQALVDARANLMTSASSLLKTYIAFKNSNKQLQIDNYKAEYIKRLQDLNAEFINSVNSGEIPQDKIATAYQKFTSDDLAKYSQTINLYLTAEQSSELQNDFNQMAQQNFVNILSKQLLANEQQLSKANLNKIVANINDLAAMGLAGIAEIAAIYDTEDLNKIGEFHYQQAWPEQKKDLQSTSLSYFYNSLADELYQQYDEIKLTRLSQLIASDKAINLTEKEQLLDKTGKLTDMTIAGKLAEQYLLEGASNGYQDPSRINKLLEENSSLTEQQKLYAQHMYTRSVEQRLAEQQADYLIKRNEAWSIIFATGDYLNIDPLLFDSLDNMTQDKMCHYKEITKTDLTLNNELLYKVMKGEQVDIINEGYQGLTWHDIQILEDRQQLLLNDPTQQKQASKICQQIDHILTNLNITETSQKINLFALIMDEIDGQQATQQQLLTTGQITEAISKVVPGSKKANKDN